MCDDDGHKLYRNERWAEKYKPLFFLWGVGSAPRGKFFSGLLVGR